MDHSRSLDFFQVSVPAGYQRFMLGQLFEPWGRGTAQARGSQPGWSVLDVASGPGPVARLAATAVGPGGRVVASDISEPMLALEAARPASAGAAPIEFVACPASQIDAPDDAFDAVLCQHGLQFFADKRAAALEMRRVARPGGIAVVSTWAAERPLGLFPRWLRRWQNSASQSPTRGPSMRTAWVPVIWQICCAPRAGARSGSRLSNSTPRGTARIRPLTRRPERPSARSSRPSPHRSKTRCGPA